MIDPLEIAVIVGALAIFLIWGPSKIPALARSLGSAQREYKKAQTSTEEDANVANVTAEGNSVSDDKLLEVAHSLGINTQGKTMDQIAREIVAKKLA